MPFPALSTGNFNNYERKCKNDWNIFYPSLVVLLLRYSVYGKMQISGIKEITNKGRDNLYDSFLSSSLLRNIPCDSLAKGETFTLQKGKRHQYNAKNLSVILV